MIGIAAVAVLLIPGAPTAIGMFGTWLSKILNGKKSNLSGLDLMNEDKKYVPT